MRIKRASTPKRKKSKSTARLKKILWKHFTLWIKERDKNICFTCGKKCFGWDCHGGHFIPKSIGGILLYFNEDNVHVQCARCNLSEQGNQYIYGQKLGKDKVQELQTIRLKSKNVIWDREKFLEKIAYYKKKTK